MSALDVMRSIRDLRFASSTQKAVLYALALRANDKTGQAWPSYDTIAKDAGVSLRCAKVTVAGLVRSGHLTVTKRHVDGKMEAESNLYVVHVVHEVVHDDHHVVQQVHDGGAAGARQVVHDVHEGGAPSALELPIELPKGTAQGRSFALTGDPVAPKGAPKKAKREPKHSPEDIAAKDKIVAAFVESFEAKKRVKPKTIDVADHAAAFKLAKTYGADEACAIVRRAFDDIFVVEKNCTLKFIASKADTFRGSGSSKQSGRHMVQPVPKGGSIWKAGLPVQPKAAERNGE